VKKFLGILVLSLGLVLFNSCAKPTVINVIMPEDEKLSCKQLKEEFAETRRFKQEAKAVKEANTGANMTRVILFWPALLKTMHNADVAIRAANDRAYHLIDIMKNINCKDTDKLYSELSKADTLTISYEINRLHRLYKSGALTEEEFKQAKKKVLGQ
jgi:maltodextrin utilization protein YvdJ